MLGNGFGFGLQSAWLWTVVGWALDLALDSGRLVIDLALDLALE